LSQLSRGEPGDALYDRDRDLVGKMPPLRSLADGRMRAADVVTSAGSAVQVSEVSRRRGWTVAPLAVAARFSSRSERSLTERARFETQFGSEEAARLRYIARHDCADKIRAVRAPHRRLTDAGKPRQVPVSKSALGTAVLEPGKLELRDLGLLVDSYRPRSGSFFSLAETKR
jgi:hypothetical protein